MSLIFFHIYLHCLNNFKPCTICKKDFSFRCRLNSHMQSFHVSKASKELDFGLDTANANAAVVANDQSTNSDSQSEKDLTANPIPLIGEVYTCSKCDKSYPWGYLRCCGGK